MAARVIPLFLPLLLAGCGMAPPRIVAPPPAPVAAPSALAPRPATSDWRDAPLTPGGWRYDRDATGSTARFDGADTTVDFTIRCDQATRTVTLSGRGAVPGTVAITTSYGTRSWPAVASTGGRIALTLSARDPFLDELAFSRARFMVEGLSPSRLILPAWAEPARVIEDCRG